MRVTASRPRVGRETFETASWKMFSRPLIVASEALLPARCHRWLEDPLVEVGVAIGPAVPRSKDLRSEIVVDAAAGEVYT
jgi:hypothetical protein